MSSRVTRAASASRRRHQHPATMSSLAPAGPPRTDGDAPECSGGPSPRLAALGEARCAAARASVH
eukprot:15437960-Alexandrium_andersonii.AAC.1